MSIPDHFIQLGFDIAEAREHADDCHRDADELRRKAAQAADRNEWQELREDAAFMANTGNAWADRAFRLEQQQEQYRNCLPDLRAQFEALDSAAS